MGKNAVFTVEEGADELVMGDAKKPLEEEKPKSKKIADAEGKAEKPGVKSNGKTPLVRDGVTRFFSADEIADAKSKGWA